MKEIVLVLPGFLLWKQSRSTAEAKSDLLRIPEWEFILPFSLFGVFATGFSWLLTSFVISLWYMVEWGTFSFELHSYTDDFFYINFFIACFISVCLGKSNTDRNPCVQNLCSFFLPSDTREVNKFYENIAQMGSVIITLKNYKVYYAVPVEVKGDTLASAYIRIVPFASGYRTKDELRVRLTADYISLENMQLIVNLAEVETISKYDAVNFDYRNNLLIQEFN